jgi:hypothetical protein
MGEITFEAALRRLRDRLSGEGQPEPPRERVSRNPEAPPRPWEMTRGQFDAAAEPTIQLAWGTTRFRGLSRAVLRREVHFLLRCPGGPVDGYRVRVPARRADLHDQPHRAFVEAALADGLSVPSAVLSDYPELKEGRWEAPSPRLDFTASS